ncbi:MAG: HAD family phosphatase [Spirochaetales bacterium]|jgi:HAD superfamily hydrolase (TIGR01509 family)
MLFVDGFAIEAVAFDMDGLMFDTERLANELWMTAGAESGWDLSLELLTSLAGQPGSSDRRALGEAHGEDFPYDARRARRIALEAEYFRDHEVPLMPGLLELVNFLGAEKIPMAVATSTARYRVLPLLRKAGIIERFASILCGDEVKNVKPDPEIYLRTAENLGVAPGNCLVLEDSRAGIAAAYAAGAIPVMVPDLLQPDEATFGRAARVFGSLGEVLGWLARAAISSRKPRDS